MGSSYEDELQDSLVEWAKIEEQQILRRKKDEMLISKFCVENDYADVIRTLALLEKRKGMPTHDCEKVQTFKKNYPDSLTIQDIVDFMDVRDLYGRYLESGGKMR